MALLTFAAINVKGLRKVPRLAVDVDVLGVEARAALGEGLLEHGAHFGEKPCHGTCRQIGRGGLGVQAGSPQRLVGVDVADAADNGLIEKHALDRRPLGAHGA